MSNLKPGSFCSSKEISIDFQPLDAHKPSRECLFSEQLFITRKGCLYESPTTIARSFSPNRSSDRITSKYSNIQDSTIAILINPITNTVLRRRNQSLASLPFDELPGFLTIVCSICNHLFYSAIGLMKKHGESCRISHTRLCGKLCYDLLRFTRGVV